MSDHISGPRAIAGPAGDITDLYMFPSPARAGHLTLVMNVHPFAGPSTFFSDAITYRLRLRPVTITGTGHTSTFQVGEEEWVVVCAFGEEGPIGEQSHLFRQLGRCTVSTGETVSFVVNDEQGGQTDGLRVFAGRRSDPFFLDVGLIRDTVMKGLPISTGRGENAGRPENSLNGAAVLSIVVEIDYARFLGRDVSLLALVGETRVSGKLPVLIERVGRPEIKNFLMSPRAFDPVNSDIDLRDLYNSEDAFNLIHEYLDAYRARLNANLSIYDGLDGKNDWPLQADGSHPLTDLLLDDFLVLDPTKPFTEQSTFEIEQSMLQGQPHLTCGGRSLNDDAVDRLLTWVVGSQTTDGVDQATVRASYTFPYLVTAHQENMALR